MWCCPAPYRSCLPKGTGPQELAELSDGTANVCISTWTAPRRLSIPIHGSLPHHPVPLNSLILRVEANATGGFSYQRTVAFRLGLTRPRYPPPPRRSYGSIQGVYATFTTTSITPKHLSLQSFADRALPTSTNSKAACVWRSIRVLQSLIQAFRSYQSLFRFRSDARVTRELSIRAHRPVNKNISKVIYCIRALSHLLAREGLARWIGNLLGQLQFSDDRLTETQKGLTGMSIPNFQTVGRDVATDTNVEPEPGFESERL